MTEPKKQAIYYVVFFIIDYTSVQEAKLQDPESIAAHLKRSKEWHEQGKLVMAGAFLDSLDEHLSTMGVLTSRAAAEEYAEGDPFVKKGKVIKWYIREWANMLV